MRNTISSSEVRSNTCIATDLEEYFYDQLTAEAPLDIAPIQTCPLIEYQASKITLSKGACAVLVATHEMEQTGFFGADIRKHRTLGENLEKNYRLLKKGTVKILAREARKKGLINTTQLYRPDGGYSSNERVCTELGKAVLRRLERGESLKNTPAPPHEKPKNTPGILFINIYKNNIKIFKQRKSVDKSKRLVKKPTVIRPSFIQLFAFSLFVSLEKPSGRCINDDAPRQICFQLAPELIFYPPHPSDYSKIDPPWTH